MEFSKNVQSVHKIQQLQTVVKELDAENRIDDRPCGPLCQPS